MATGNPVLELSTLADGLPITIDQAVYEIRHPASFSIGELKQIDKLTKRSGAIEIKTEPSEDELAQWQEDMSALCDLVLDAPDAVKAKLRDIQKIAVLRVFAMPRTTTKPSRAAKTASKSPSAKRSRDSRGSTAAVRTSGTGKRRSRSSARRPG